MDQQENLGMGAIFIVGLLCGFLAIGLKFGAVAGFGVAAFTLLGIGWWAAVLSIKKQ